MIGGATIIADAFSGLELYFQRMPEAATEAARMAINDIAAGRGMSLARREIEDQVAFPAGYINNDRMAVSKRATNADLEAIITARQRPTSLARFAQGDKTPGKPQINGIQVVVHSGNSKTMRKAFFVKLRAGKSATDDNYNIGLAIRLKPGERVIYNKKQQNMVQLSHGVYVLYGPSIEQIFRSVADEIAPELLNMLSDEFLRQFTRLTDG
jgi:hypothetical protein